MQGQAKLEREIAALGDLPREKLVALWVKTHRCPPPKGIKQGLLLRSATFHLQQKRLGGISSESRRVLKTAMRRIEMELTEAARQRRSDLVRGATDEEATVAIPASAVEVAGSAATAGAIASPRIRLRPGARLVRDWNGRTNIVEVTEDGFLFEGKNWRSLSAIARKITGAHWSGPRFFGL